MRPLLIGLMLGTGLFCMWWSFWPTEEVEARPRRTGLRVRLADDLAQAGYVSVTPGNVITACALGLILVFVLVLASTRVAPVAACFAAMAGYAPLALVRMRARKRRAQMRDLWPDDEYVFSKQLADLKTEQQPFFSVLLTLSSHQPFEVPLANTPFDNGNSLPQQFKKAAYYTDYCLGNYFKEAKKQPWYAKTLFVLVADHGHRLPLERDMNMPESRRITLLFCGGALKNEYQGKTVEKIIAQTDLPAIILSQLNADSVAPLVHTISRGSAPIRSAI